MPLTKLSIDHGGVLPPFITGIEHIQLMGIGEHSACVAHYSCAAYKDPVDSSNWLVAPPRFARFVPKRRAEFVAGRYCASQALLRLGWPGPAVVESEGRNPRWPRGIVGSISHCSRLAIGVAAFAETSASIGVDCEKLIEDQVVQEIAPLVLRWDDAPSPREIDGATYFSAIFSAKESYAKALPSSAGPVDFQSIRVDQVTADYVYMATVDTGLESRISPHERFAKASWRRVGEYLLTVVRFPSVF
jgi:enterobactin synthetase component D